MDRHRWAGWLLVGVAATALAAGCGSGTTTTPGGGASPDPSAATATPPAAPASQAATPSASLPVQTAAPTATATDLPFGGAFPHQAPDLEAMLPTVVAGRSLTTWSIRGADFFGFNSLTPEQVAEIRAELAAEGLELDDVGMAIAGRSDVAASPPYFVDALRFAGVPADTLPRGAGLTHPDAGTWTEATVGGKPVLVGTEAMLDQTEDLVGRPYLYNSGDIRFIVATADEAWAADALGQLP